jgi:hypothetical protein
MKNRTPNQRQTQTLDWLYQEEGDDFLQGRTASELPDVWEDEE